MQQMSQTLIDAVRGQYQIPIAKIEIYNQDGSLAGEITDDVLSIGVDVSGSRKVKRMLDLSLDNKDGKYTPDPDLYENNLLWYNKTVKIYEGFKTGVNFDSEELLPQGEYIINDIETNKSASETILTIKGLDKMNLLYEDKFENVFTVEDAAATESDNYALATQGASATGSSSLTAGDEIQMQGRIHSLKTTAIIGGIKREITNDNTDSSSNPVRMIDGYTSSGWLLRYTPKDGETLTEIEADVFFDLQEEEDVQQINIVMLAGSALTDFVEVSPDNASWEQFTTATFTPVNKVRFIRFKVRATAAEASGDWITGVTEIQIQTASTYSAAAAIDGDIQQSSWRPAASDVNPQLDIVMSGSRTLNVINLHWGSNPFDFDSRVSYYLEKSSDAGATWQRITDLNGLDETVSVYGDVEHVFADLAMSRIRIKIISWSGSIQLRHVRAQKVTATEYIDKVMRDVLNGAGIPESIKIQEDDQSVSFSEGWTRPTASVYDGGSLRASSIAGSTAEITFVGTGIQYIGTKYNSYGMADVYLDDEFIQKVDLYNASTQYKQVLFEKKQLRAGVHKLRIEVTGEKNASSGGTAVVVDSFVIFKYSIPMTRNFVRSMQADVGDEKADFLQRLAHRAGWQDPEMDENGLFMTKKRDINPVDVAWEIKTDTDNIYEFSPLFSNDIKNVILAVYSGSDQKTITGVAMDDNPLSPTYIGKLGRRVEKYERESFDSQEKADLFAQEKLFERTRFKHSTAIPMTANPALQTDDVVTVDIIDTKIKGVKYIITGYKSSFAADPRSFDMTLNISQL